MQTQTLFSLLQKIPGCAKSGRFWKCGGLFCYYFLNRSYYCPKWGQISRFLWVASLKKIDMQLILSFLLPYSITMGPIGMFWGWFNGRIIMTNSKYQTPLTLSSHNSGLKNDCTKSHHIFRTGRTSAFIWHTLKFEVSSKPSEFLGHTRTDS